MIAGKELHRHRLATTVLHDLAGKLIRETANALGPSAFLMPMKGVLLGRTHYPSVALRPISDCDVLVVAPSLRDSVARLRAAGFRLLHGSRDLTAMALRSPIPNVLTLDLHARPLPAGLGPLDPTWLMRGARRDTALFDTPVWLPEDRWLLVQLVGNVLKDHIVHASAHTATDIAMVLRSSRSAPLEFATAIRSARLTAGALAVLDWLALDDAVIVALRTALAPSRSELTQAAKILARARAETPGAPLRLVARVLARSVSDSRAHAALGIGAAALGVLNRALPARLAGWRGRWSERA